jgi:putative ABC transport system substrate-binding protein
MMDRRTFMATSAIAILAAPPVTARQAVKIYRLGVLGNVALSDSVDARPWGALTRGLRDRGYVEGHNLIVEHRSSEARFERLPGLAAELVRPATRFSNPGLALLVPAAERRRLGRRGVTKAIV